ncbi:MAG: hypothetical protein EOP38_19635 [Rubrivivax sp.]|nr:MAG: hypothetical protein EOP38_19635 [Rubrivivax sp.]
MRYFSWVLLLALLAGNGIGATLENTTITLLMIDKNHGNKIFIKTSIPHAKGTPSCHTSDWDFVMPYDDQLDKAMFALLLASNTTQKPVTLYGTGTCAIRPDIETLQRTEAR